MDKDQKNEKVLTGLENYTEQHLNINTIINESYVTKSELDYETTQRMINDDKLHDNIRDSIDDYDNIFRQLDRDKQNKLSNGSYTMLDATKVNVLDILLGTQINTVQNNYPLNTIAKTIVGSINELNSMIEKQNITIKNMAKTLSTIYNNYATKDYVNSKTDVDWEEVGILSDDGQFISHTLIAGRRYRLTYNWDWNNTGIWDPKPFPSNLNYITKDFFYNAPSSQKVSLSPISGYRADVNVRIMDGYSVIDIYHIYGGTSRFILAQPNGIALCYNYGGDIAMKLGNLLKLEESLN